MKVTAVPDPRFPLRSEAPVQVYVVLCSLTEFSLELISL